MEKKELPVEVFKRGDYVQPEGEKAIILVTGWTNTEKNFRGAVVEAPINAPYPLRLGEYSETWHAKKFKKVDYATKLQEAEDKIKELERQNEKLKATANGWRPLLEEVMNKHGAIILMHDNDFYEKIKTFLYGE